MTEFNCIEPLYWGHIDYQNADELQALAWEKVQQGHPGLILGGTVDLIVTHGLRGKESAVLNSQWPSVRTRRGGETTLHSPGQLLIYPILNLRSKGWGVKRFVEILLRSSEVALQELGVPAHLNWSPVGLWTARGKIGFCGVQVKNGISQHGLALNIDNDLQLFKGVISCGLSQVHYDKASHYCENSLDLQLFFTRWCAHFCLLSKNLTVTEPLFKSPYI